MNIKLSMANKIALDINFALHACGEKIHRHVADRMFAHCPEIPHSDCIMKKLEIEMLTLPYIQADIYG